MPWPTPGVRHTYPPPTIVSNRNATPGEFKRIGEWPVSTEVGAWGGAEFVRIIGRHKQRMGKYPSEPPAYGVPYDGITNLRPETKAAVDAFLMKQKSPQM